MLPVSTARIRATAASESATRVMSEKMTNTKFRQLALDKALKPAKVSDFANWLDKQ